MVLRIRLAAAEGIAEVERRFIQYADSQRLDAGSTLAVILIVGVPVWLLPL